MASASASAQQQQPKKRSEGRGRARVRPSDSSSSRGREGGGDREMHHEGDGAQSAETAALLVSPSAVLHGTMAHQDGQPPHRSGAVVVVSRARYREIERRFWLEKAAVLCDAAQIYALVWQLSQPWPWPARWLRATRWVSALNLDVFSFRATGAAMGATSQPFSLWGEMPRYWFYALLFALLPSCGFAVCRVVCEEWRRSGRSDHLVLKMRLESVLLQLYQRLYLPIGLAVLRLVNCDANGAVSVDPVSMGECWSAGHAAAVFVVTICLGGSFLLGLPWILRRRTRKYLTQPCVEKHERFVRSKELEFVLGTSETYLDLHMPLHASFVRHSVRQPVEMCALKLVLLLIFSLLRSPFPDKANQGVQGTLFVAAISLFAIKRTIQPPFRIMSSSRLACLADWTLVSNGFFVLMCASGVRSALTVSTTMTSCLTFVNVCFVIAIGLSLCHSGHQWARGNRGEHRQLRSGTEGLSSPPPSPSWWLADECSESALKRDPSLPQWVDAIEQAKAAVRKALLVTPSMRSVDALGAVFQRLQISREEAVQANHLLADQLSELLLYVNEIYVEALASNPYHRMQFPEKELMQLTHTLQRRDQRQVLLSSRSRRVMSKIKASSAWKAVTAKSVPEPQCAESSAGAEPVRSFLNACSAQHAPQAVLVADWQVVNSLFLVHGGQASPHLSSSTLLRVLRWSQTTKLVQVQLETVGSYGIVAVSATAIYRGGFELELVECGEAQATEALMSELRGNKVDSHGKDDDKARELEALAASTDMIRV